MRIPPSQEQIAAAQAGDKLARDALTLHFLPLIRDIANKMRPACLAAEDLWSEGIVAFLEELPKFDPALGDFRSFVYFRVSRRLLDYIDRERQFYTRWKGGVPERTMEPASVAETIDDLLSPLSDEQRELVMDYYGLLGRPERTSQEIGAALGMSDSAVRKAVAKALRSVRVRILGYSD